MVSIILRNCYSCIICTYLIVILNNWKNSIDKVSFQWSSARFWLKKLLAQVHTTQNIYLHNIVGTCTKEGLNKENTTQIAKYKKHGDLIPWKFVEMSNFFEFLFILKFVTKKMHAQCACRLENLLAQRKKCMHLCKCACVKSSTAVELWMWLMILIQLNEISRPWIISFRLMSHT